MKTNIKKTIIPCLFAGALLCAPALKASYVFNVDLNTAALTGAPNGPFYLDFQLNEGSDLSEMTTVTVSGFSFTGGSPTGSANITGNASGDIGSAVTLTAADPSSDFTELFQGFTPGTSDIKFNVTLPQLFTGLTPTQLDVAILDSETNNPQIDTNAPDTVSLVTAPILSSYTLSNIGAYSSTDNPAGVTATVTAVPEPSSIALSGLGLAGILYVLRRRRA